jgi:hypothetical protein
MKNETVQRVRRTNIRDGLTYELKVVDGTPLCPLCGQKMEKGNTVLKGNGVFGNSLCECWWIIVDEISAVETGK